VPTAVHAPPALNVVFVQRLAIPRTRSTLFHLHPFPVGLCDLR